MKNLFAVISMSLMSLSAVSYAQNVHCDCTGSCGDGFRVSAWAEYAVEQASRTVCYSTLNKICKDNGYFSVIEHSVNTTCDGGMNPNPPAPPPPPPPPSNSTYRCQVNLMTLEGIRATFYGMGSTQNMAIDQANRQCYQAISSPQEVCENAGCIL